MKKMCLLLFTLLFFVSCSTENDNNDPDDLIIGQWQFSGTKNYTVDGDSYLNEANLCSSQNTITFRINRTITSENYTAVGNSGCEVNETANENSENIPWEKISEGKYKIGSRIRDSIFFPDQNTMEMMSYHNFDEPIREVEVDRKSDIYIRID